MLGAAFYSHLEQSASTLRSIVKLVPLTNAIVIHAENFESAQIQLRTVVITSFILIANVAQICFAAILGIISGITLARQGRKLANYISPKFWLSCVALNIGVVTNYSITNLDGRYKRMFLTGEFKYLYLGACSMFLCLMVLGLAAVLVSSLKTGSRS